jgi:hypothetical protein
LKWRDGLFAIAVIVRGIGREDDQAAVDRKCLQLDAEAATLFMREAAPILVQRRGSLLAFPDRHKPIPGGCGRQKGEGQTVLRRSEAIAN